MRRRVIIIEMSQVGLAVVVLLCLLFWAGVAWLVLR